MMRAARVIRTFPPGYPPLLEHEHVPRDAYTDYVSRTQAMNHDVQAASE